MSDDLWRSHPVSSVALASAPAAEETNANTPPTVSAGANTKATGFTVEQLIWAAAAVSGIGVAVIAGKSSATARTACTLGGGGAFLGFMFGAGAAAVAVLLQQSTPSEGLAIATSCALVHAVATVGAIVGGAVYGIKSRLT